MSASDQGLVNQGILPPCNDLLDGLQLAQAYAPQPTFVRPDVTMSNNSTQPEHTIAQGYSLQYGLELAKQRAIKDSHKKYDGKNATSNEEFLEMFLAGSGNDLQIHDKPNDPTLQAFEQSPGAAAIRKQYLDANCPASTDKLGYGTFVAARETLLPGPNGLPDYSNPGVHVGGFGNPPKDTPWAAATATRCDADGKPNPNGDSVQFKVVNVAGAHSFFYHLPFIADKPVGEKGQYRTIVEEYTWVEPLPKKEK